MVKKESYKLEKDKSREDGLVIWRAKISEDFAIEVDAKTEAEARKKIDAELEVREKNL